MNRCLFLAIAITVSLFFLLDQQGYGGSETDKDELILRIYSSAMQCEQQRPILTALGMKTYAELQAEVFQGFGFTIVRNCTPFPLLKYLKRPTCEVVFKDWLNVSAQYDPKSIPVRTIPDDLSELYLANGASLLLNSYRNDKSVSNPKVDQRWTSDSVAQFMQRTDVFQLSGYGQVAASVQTAFIRYKDRIRSKRGLVIGSINPWVEVLALQQGATSMTTAEYRKIVPGDERLKYVHPVEMAQNWTRYVDQFDFIASFSSIEHSGLGRYGDPLDPIGDLREMQKLYCLLKPDQLLFLGFPVGRDEVVFNLHRIYGAVRLSMMFAGWQVLDIFFNADTKSHRLSEADLHGPRGRVRQMLFVLEKL